MSRWRRTPPPRTSSVTSPFPRTPLATCPVPNRGVPATRAIPEDAVARGRSHGVRGTDPSVSAHAAATAWWCNGTPRPPGRLQQPQRIHGLTEPPATLRLPQPGPEPVRLLSQGPSPSRPGHPPPPSNAPARPPRPRTLSVPVLLELGGPGVVELAGPTTVVPAMSLRDALDVSIPSSTPRLPAPPPARQVMRVAPTGNLHAPALDRRDDPPGHDPRQPARRTRTRTAAPRRTLGAPGGLVVPGATDRPSTPPAPRHSSCAGVSLSLVACAGRSGAHRGSGAPCHMADRPSHDRWAAARHR